MEIEDADSDTELAVPMPKVSDPDAIESVPMSNSFTLRPQYLCTH